MVPQLELPQGGEWIVILVIVVLVFGAKKLPELTRNAARAMNEFNKARSGDDDEPAQVTAPETAQQPTAQPQTAQPQATQQSAQPQATEGQAGSAGRADVEDGGSEGAREERRGLG